MLCSMMSHLRSQFDSESLNQCLNSALQHERATKQPADHLASVGPLTKGLANTFALPLTQDAISNGSADEA